ncbi:MAG: ribosome silencing factor [Bacilli bacterium]|jgi:ribosome-associated protein|nr:ribosome silencing factor [Bacilli bacterium]
MDYDSLKTAKKLAAALDFHKGEEVKLYDVSALTPLALYYIVASFSSARRASGAEDECEEIIYKNGGNLSHVEGKSSSPWILIDGEDIIIHLFSEEERARLNFDELLKRCPEIDFSSEEPEKGE